MDNKGKVIDNILRDFLKLEAEATDKRIMSIRNFLLALNEAVEKYTADEIVDEKALEDKEKIINMINDMTDIYKQEISELLVKRGKLQHYLEIFKSSDSVGSSKINQIKENISPYYIN